MQIIAWIGIGIGILPAAIVALWLLFFVALVPGITLAGLSATIKGKHDDRVEAIKRSNRRDVPFFLYTFGWFAFLVGGTVWSLDGAMNVGLLFWGIWALLWILGWWSA
jgi:hypothetical protein